MRRLFLPFVVLCLTTADASATPNALISAKAPRTIIQVASESSYGAAADDTDFLFRLGMLEGHLIIGHELIKAKQESLALPHFGHPVREIYSDITDYIDKKHIEHFDKKLMKLEAAVASEPYSADTEAQYQAVIDAVHAARNTAPAAIRNSVPEMIKVCADTIDAASGEYGEALEHGRVETIVEYHDSRGYLAYVAQQIGDMMKMHSDTADQSMLTRFKAILNKAQYIVEPLLPGPVPRGSVSQYRAIAEEAAAVTKK